MDSLGNNSIRREKLTKLIYVILGPENWRRILD